MRVPTDRSSAGTDLDPDPPSQLRSRQAELVGPAGGEELLRLGRARDRAQEGGGALLSGARQQHLAGVRVGRARLGVEVVAVVPDDDEPQVVDRGEGGRAGADHDPAGAARDREEVPVARGRAAVGGQADVVALPQQRQERGVDPGHVAVVGHADQGAPAAVVGRGDGLGDHGGPVVGRCGRPHGARGLAGPEAAEERVGMLHRRPGAPMAGPRPRAPARRLPSRRWRAAAGRPAAARRTGRRRTSGRGSRSARRSRGRARARG